MLFLHAKLWIPVDEKSIFVVVIHLWRSPLCQFVRARTVDEYDVTMPVPSISVTSQINRGDATLLHQKRPSPKNGEISDRCFWAEFSFVCCITKWFLTYSFFSPTSALSNISRPLSSYMCSIAPETVKVGSTYSHMLGSGIGCWFSDRSNCVFQDIQ